MAEEARLESVCTPKGYREFESRSLRIQKQPSANALGFFVVPAEPSLLARGRGGKKARTTEGRGLLLVVRTRREATR